VLDSAIYLKHMVFTKDYITLNFRHFISLKNKEMHMAIKKLLDILGVP